MTPTCPEPGPLTQFFQDHGWCQGALARDKDGKTVQTHDEKACFWCIAGAAVALTNPKSPHYRPELAVGSSLRHRIYDALGITYDEQLTKINDKLPDKEALLS